MLSLQEQLKSVQDRTAKRKLDKELRTKAAQLFRANALKSLSDEDAQKRTEIQRIAAQKYVDDRHLSRIESRTLLNESEYSTRNVTFAHHDISSTDNMDEAIDRDAAQYEVIICKIIFVHFHEI
jgi:hypothetical protein